MTVSGMAKQNGSRKITAGLPFSLLLALALLLLLPRIVILPSQNAGALYGYFDRYARVDFGGERDAQLKNVSQTLASYLSFQTDSAQTMVMGEDAFSDKELHHLRDVRVLYALAVKLSWIGLALLLLVIAASLLKAQSLKSGAVLLFKRLRLAGALILLLLLLIGLYALLDFTGVFYAFHHLAFTNDLWLLNPQEDLLIQLMPEPFFTDYLARTMLPVFLGLLLVTLPTYKLLPDKKEP